jgi:3-hydroxyisobutyrate dehydrogenase-like beta-hydroxyacid dehydrogenase
MTVTDGLLAFVGAGQLGMPMVRRLARAGRDVTVFVRRPDVRDECVAVGAQATMDVRAAVQDADAVLVCLYSDTQVRELALGSDGFLGAMRHGSTLIVHTTGSPAMTRALAEHGADRDIRVVEAPVSGSAQDITDGRVTVLLGGDPAHLETARAIVGAYGDPILTIGPLGSALAVKLLNNALFAAQLQLAGEVERVAASFGVDMAAAAAAIQQSSGSSYAMGVVERSGSLAAVAAAAGHFLQKDLDVVDEVVLDLDLDLGVLDYVNRYGPLTFLARQLEGDV